MPTPEAVAARAAQAEAQALIDAKRTPPNITPEYVAELMRENKNLRTKADETLRKENESLSAKLAQANAEKETSEKLAIEHADNLKKVSEEVAAKLVEENTKRDQRIIRAELKAEAVKLGVIDLDVLKLADTSKLTLDDDGEVVGGVELIAALKVSKPWAFSEKKSTASTEKTPKSGDPKPFNAMTATKEELAAKKKELGLTSGRR